MAILTGLPPSARGGSRANGQNGAEAGIEALFAGRGLNGHADGQAQNSAGNDPFSAALQVALSRVSAQIQEDQQIQLDTAALAAQGQILPNGAQASLDKKANFAAADQVGLAQTQSVDAAAQTGNAPAGQVVAVPTDQTPSQMAVIGVQGAVLSDKTVSPETLVDIPTDENQGLGIQDTKLVTGLSVNGQPTVQSQAASALQLTPGQLAHAQAAVAQQAADGLSENAPVEVNPALLANLPSQALVSSGGPANGQQNSAANAVGVATMVQVDTGPQTANQHAANEDQSGGTATGMAGLLSAVVDQSSIDEADLFAALMDKQQMAPPAMVASSTNQSAQLANQLSANGQALNAAQTPAGSVINDLQTVTESASAQLAARTESRVEALRASLGSGPLNMEVLKLTSAGGGRAVIEVTPPNQGPIRLDLQLDGNGKANLVVDGLTDSMRARLESSAGFLRQDMADMGLTLNLELRERDDGRAAMQFSQQFSGSNQSGSSSGSWNSDRSALDPEGLVGPVGRGQSNTPTDNGINLYA